MRWPRSTVAALGAIAAAAVPAAWLWGFTVDDALVSARYATNLARGFGYRFNATGPITDGVTPLGWAVLLAPFARGGPLAALAAAKVLGLGLWLGAAALLGIAVERAGQQRIRYAALLLCCCSAPMAAWSVSGMETGLCLALGAVAAAACGPLARPRLGSVAAGLAAGLRPELLPWALTLALATSVARDERPGPPSRSSPVPIRPYLVLAAGAAAPFVVVVLVRLVVFGHPAPLALWAKPSDFAHGWRYAVACLLLAGPLAVLGWGRVERWCRGFQLALGVHWVAVAVAGGDWMPLSRLVVPVLPSVVVAGAHLLCRSRGWVGVGRLVLTLAGLGFAAWRAGPAAARVGADRSALIAELRGSFTETRVVAALDIGWVGAATDATVLDLAGITDPAIATLPGGHTSKQIPAQLLTRREVDTLVLLLPSSQSLKDPWTDSPFSRLVERRIASLPSMAQQFEPVYESTHPRLHYVVLRRTDARR